MRKVLLLTASFGDGHIQAANALKEALCHEGWIVKMVDYLDWFHPTIKTFAKLSLVQGVQRAPKLYGMFYQAMSSLPPSSQIQKSLNHMGVKKLMQCLESFNPDVVVSTFPTPNGVMSALRADGLTSIPNVAVLTDYTAHGQWIHAHTDMYFVANDTVKEELMVQGVPSEKIRVSGIPLRQKFIMTKGELFNRRQYLRRKHGLGQDTPLVLMMGGGCGVLGNPSNWEHLMGQPDVQFAVICGHNRRIQRQFQRISSTHTHVLGYIDEVDEWMAMSDLVVTKAGGITVTESLAMELPMVLFGSIPGQEERNAIFATQSGAAVRANSFAGVEHWITTLMSNRKSLGQMRLAARACKVQDATRDITQSLSHLLGDCQLETRTTLITMGDQLSMSYSI